jgi:hypothetical protein
LIKRFGTSLLAAGLLAGGPYDITLLPTPSAPAALGTARLVNAASPFGIAVSPDGHARYDIVLRITGLPAPGTLGAGAYHTYVAWAATPDLKDWTRLGVVTNGTSTVGVAQLNKFLLVITAETGPEPVTRGGPTVLHGTSPSGWMQTFLAHPFFRGAPGK